MDLWQSPGQSTAYTAKEANEPVVGCTVFSLHHSLTEWRDELPR